MDFTALLQQIDRVSEQNKNVFCNTNKNNKHAKDISGILYFNDEEFQSNTNFLENNNQEELYTINVEEEKEKISTNTYKKLSQKVKLHVDLEEYNLSHKYSNLTECILSVLKYYNYNAQNLFFKKLLKDFDIYKLFKKYNCKKRIRKAALRKLIISKEDNDDNVRQLLADYLNINLIILTNTEILTYCKENTYEVFRPTVVVYEYNGSYNSLSDKITNKSIFTSDDFINMKLAKYFLTKDIVAHEKKKKEQSVIEALNKKKEEEKKAPKLIDFKKLKVAELRSLCEQYHITTKEKNDKGKMKNIVKKVLIEKLKIILG